MGITGVVRHSASPEQVSLVSSMNIPAITLRMLRIILKGRAGKSTEGLAQNIVTSRKTT